jgi:DNA-binding HxlR family transcriptional regulator/putative sterol carrier protein
MRSYRQFCPAARALDLVGERWTLLVIRELLFGPKRYTDLQDGLPGIGPNVLATRLRSLESTGLIRKRRLPPPAASTVYELTELGASLRPTVFALFNWGMQLLGAPAESDTIKASYWLPAIEAALRSDRLPADANDVYEFRIGHERISIVAKDGQVEVRDGPSESPDLVVHADQRTFVELGLGRISPIEAVEAGRLSFEGDSAPAERCAGIFGLLASERATAPA